MMNAGFTDLLPAMLMGLLALLLVVAAIIDVRTFTISNRLNMAVALLAPLFWWASDLPLWPGATWQIATAVGVFVLLALAFYAGMMGGGDVKLAAALALWFPPLVTVKFLAVMSLAGGAVTVIALIIHRLARREGRTKVPYGVAIAFGGLAILAEPFLNHFGR